MRFFVKNRFDVHNSGMATDRHQAPSYPLRMPDELKARIQAAADASGRSLHGELLYRLQNSFEAREVGWDVRVAMHTNEVRAEVLGSNISVMQMHVNMLLDRLRLLRQTSADTEEIQLTLDSINTTREEIARMTEQRLKVLAEGHALHAQYQDQAQKLNELMDLQADAALQDQYREIHERNTKIGVPAQLSEKVVYVVPPKGVVQEPAKATDSKPKPAAKRSSKKA